MGRAPTGPAPARASGAALARLGYDARVAEALAAWPSARPLRVLRDGRGALLATDGCEEWQLATPAELRPVAGDWIAVEPRTPEAAAGGGREGDRRAGADATAPGAAQIVDVAARASALVRPRADGLPQVLAANIDDVGVVVPLDRPLNRRWLERALVLAHDSGARPLVLLSKRDLTSDLAAAQTAVAATALGVDVLAVSGHTGAGLADLRARLAADRTMALLGASGSGKSTLVNALVGRAVMAVAAVRAGDAKGRHTTTHRQLLVVPSGGLVLDTPGVRSLAVGLVTDGLAAAFPDVATVAVGCHFGDCTHAHEPGCAVAAARTRGDLAADRVAGWQRIHEEVRTAAGDADPATRRQWARQWGRADVRAPTRLRPGMQPPVAED